jgi:hypothetical protein
MLNLSLSNMYSISSQCPATCTVMVMLKHKNIYVRHVDTNEATYLEVNVSIHSSKCINIRISWRTPPFLISAIDPLPKKEIQKIV